MLQKIFKTGYNQPFLLVSFVFILYIIKDIFLVLKITNFNSAVLVSAIGLHILCGYFYLRFRNNSTDNKLSDRLAILENLSLCYILIVISLLISSIIYDFSFDGQSYHQESIIRLKAGWNPFYQVIPDSQTHTHTINFPKSTWIYASVIFDLSGNIELGKSYNLIFFPAAFFYVLSFVRKFQKNTIPALGITLLFTANPFVLTLMFTYHVDGLIALLILISLISLINFVQTEKRSEQVESLLMLIIASILAINSKFSGLTCGIMLIGYILRELFRRRYKNVLWLTAAGIFILLIGIFCMGYNPYITNFLYYGDPLFMSMWPVIEKVSYTGFFRNCIYYSGSLFFIDNWQNIPFHPLKLLNFFKPGDIRDHLLYDRGFGLFFIEICVLAAIMFFHKRAGLISKAPLHGSESPSKRNELLFPCFLIFLSFFIALGKYCLSYGSGVHLARLVPYLWYFPCFLLLNIDFASKKLLTGLLIILVLINNGSLLVVNTAVGVLHTVQERKTINEIKTIPDQNIAIVLQWGRFRYAVQEKLTYFKVTKNISFVIDHDRPKRYFTYIKDYYVNPE